MTESVEKTPHEEQDSPAQPRLTLGEACEALGVPPSTFRQLIAEFEDLLDDDQDDEGDVATLGPASMERLREIVQWRNQGVPAEEIRARLQGAPAAAAVAPDADAHEKLLLQQLQRLDRALQRSEEQRIEDRDRMLTAMMRTQQEIQQLRYTLAANSSRRDRKKKGLFRRLFG